MNVLSNKLKEDIMNSTKYIEIFTKNQREEIKDVTVKRKLQTVQKLFKYLEKNQIEDFSHLCKNTVYEFLNSLDYRSQTISNVQFTLREFFNIMHEQNLVSFNGYQLFPIITTNKRDSILSYYSPEEIKILVESIDITKKCGIRNKCMVLIAAECGLRASDIVWLRFDEIKWDKMLISKIQHKTGIRVIVPFSKKVQFLLLDYLKNYRPPVNSEYIFINTVTNSAFTSANILTQTVYKNFNTAGIERRNRKQGAHTLRHSLATIMLTNNTPVPVITGVLGHVNSKTTQKYLSIDIEGLRQVSLEVLE